MNIILFMFIFALATALITYFYSKEISDIFWSFIAVIAFEFLILVLISIIFPNSLGINNKTDLTQEIAEISSNFEITDDKLKQDIKTLTKIYTRNNYIDSDVIVTNYETHDKKIRVIDVKVKFKVFVRFLTDNTKISIKVDNENPQNIDSQSNKACSEKDVKE